MKIALTTRGDGLDSALDPRFGRAAKFLFYTVETGETEMVDNQPQLDAALGAGIQAAATVAHYEADALITGHCGPKAFRVLHAAGVKIFPSRAETVEEALSEFRAGILSEAESAGVEGHWV